jgi:hypothetical protein
MKYIAAVLFTILLAVMAGWFAKTFTIIETSTEGEWLILRGEQAAECRAGRGCAVYSAREFEQRMLLLLQRWQERQGTGVGI